MRQLASTVALLAPNAALLLATAFRRDGAGDRVLVLGAALGTFSNGGYMAGYLDLPRRHTAVLMPPGNSIGHRQPAGGLGPSVTGYILGKHPHRWDWDRAFCLSLRLGLVLYMGGIAVQPTIPRHLARAGVWWRACTWTHPWRRHSGQMRPLSSGEKKRQRVGVGVGRAPLDSSQQDCPLLISLWRCL